MSALAEKVADLMENPPSAWLRTNNNRTDSKIYEVGYTDAGAISAASLHVMSAHSDYGVALAAQSRLLRQRLVEQIDKAIAEGAPLTGDFGVVATTLGFFSSVIKSGEAWSPQCEAAGADAHQALVRIGSAVQP